MRLLNRWKHFFQLTEPLQELKRYSPMTFAIERFFFTIQLLSPATLFFLSRKEAHDRQISDADVEKMTIKRSHQIDFYILAWFGVLATCALIAPYARGTVSRICLIVPLFHVFNILQVTVNMTLFDHLRVSRRHSVSGITRTLVLTLWNYFEIIFAFGIVYSVIIDKIENASSPIDAYYFSAITQLTIGYGDLKPLEIARLIASIQGILGTIFISLVITRFVTLMPRISSVQPEEQKRIS